MPDIGEPFDVEAFRAFTIPDDRNAFVLFRQAAATLKPLNRYVGQSLFNHSNWMAGWSETTPEVRQWAADNRQALALFRLGAERPDALDSTLASPRDHNEMSWAIECLKRLALLEATRLEDRGDMAGAWGWYRAVLQLIHQVSFCAGQVRRRQYARDYHYRLRDSLTTWARDPRTSPSVLRQALDDAIACESLTPSESYTLKAEYLEIEKWFDDPGSPGHPPNTTFRNLGSPYFPPEPWTCAGDHRSVRMGILSAAETAEPAGDPAIDEQPAGVLRPAPGSAARSQPRRLRMRYLSVRTRGQPGQRRCAVALVALDRWLGTTEDAQKLLPRLDWRGVRRAERMDHRLLLILLGTELYRRRRSRAPIRRHRRR